MPSVDNDEKKSRSGGLACPKANKELMIGKPRLLGGLRNSMCEATYHKEVYRNSNGDCFIANGGSARSISEHSADQLH
jgi:hypothetical protein